MNTRVLLKALPAVEVLLERGRTHLVLPQLVDAYLRLGWMERQDGRLVVSEAGRQAISEHRGWDGKDPVR
jgi:hypothetical protein